MKIYVKDQKLTLEDCESIGEGAIGFATFTLSCNSKWQGYHKTVRFYHEEEGVFCDVPEVEEDGVYYIPSSVLKKGKVSVGVIGIGEGSSFATTVKACFEISEAIDSGRAPTEASNVYAGYVRQVTNLRGECHEAESNASEHAAKSEQMKCETEKFSREAFEALGECRRIFEKASAMLDAMGIALREARECEARVASTDASLSENEAERDYRERTRVISEKKRCITEEERRSAELDRRASEWRRENSEQVRALGYAAFSKRLAELEERFDKLEASEPECECESSEGENSFQVNGVAEAVTLFGASNISGGRLKGIGEKGTIAFDIGTRRIEVSVSAPLYSVGDEADSVTVTSDGEVTVVRRIATEEIDPSASIMCEETDDGTMLYVVPLKGEFPSPYKEEALASGINCRARVSGDYVFFRAARDEYPDIASFAKKLKESRVKIAYVKMREATENEGSVLPFGESENALISYKGKFSVKYKNKIKK